VEREDGEPGAESAVHVTAQWLNTIGLVFGIAGVWLARVCRPLPSQVRAKDENGWQGRGYQRALRRRSCGSEAPPSCARKRGHACLLRPIFCFYLPFVLWRRKAALEARWATSCSLCPREAASPLKCPPAGECGRSARLSGVLGYLDTARSRAMTQPYHFFDPYLKDREARRPEGAGILMPTINLPDDELAAVIAAVRGAA
jgi:hypothetical protein